MSFDAYSQLYNVTGSAVTISPTGCYRLTNTTSQSGAVWDIYKIDLTLPFDFIVTLNFGNRSIHVWNNGVNCGADGISFILQPLSTGVFGPGGGVGFHGISPSLGVIMDTYTDNAGDPSYQHISINKNGDEVDTSPNEITSYTTAIGFPANITDGLGHLFRVKWTPSGTGTGTLNVYFGNNATTLPITPTITYTGNIVSTIFSGNPNVFWGFSGSTGGCWNTQTVCMTLVSNYISDTTACVGQSVVFTNNSISAATITSWAWDFGDGYTSTLQNPTHTYTTAGLYTVKLTVTNSNGQTSLMAHTVNVHPLPIVNVNNASICKGNTATLTATGALTYTWNNGLTPGAVKLVSPLTSTSYIVTGVNTWGCSNKDTAFVTILPSPVITATTDTICVGGTASLTAGGATTYLWTPGNSTSNPFIVSPTVTTTYKVVGINTSGCKDSTTTKVVVNPKPVLTSTNDTICKGETAILTASGATSYKWTPGNSTANPLLISPLVTTTYKVVGTNAFGCKDSANTTVVVNPNPTITATTDTICIGGTASLTASGANSYKWIPSNSNSNPLVVSPLVTTIYKVIGTNTSGCKDSTNTIVVVLPNPIITATTDTICIGETATLTASGGNTYTWVPSNSNSNPFSVSPIITTTYKVIGVSTFGCKDSTTTKVVVNPKPIITATTDTICKGETATITASGAATYLWIPTNSTSNPLNVNPIITTIYKVIGTSTSGCKDSTTTTVVVNPTPVITATSDTICVGGSATLTASGGNTYIWLSGNSTANPLVVNPVVTTTYKVVGTSVFGCKDSVTTQVVVNQNPIVIVNSDSICKGDSATLTATGASTYTWNNGLTPGAIKKVSPLITTSYIVTGSYSSGCSSKDTALVTVISNPVITATTDTICIGETASLVASGGSTYKWTPTNSTANPLLVCPTITTQYKVVGKNFFGCKDSANTIVIVNPLPVITATTDTICAGLTAKLVASGGVSYKWNPTNSNANPLFVSPLVTTIYKVTGTNIYGCKDSTTTKVVVNPKPTITATTDTICKGETASILASGASNYMWIPSNSIANPLIVNPIITTIYKVIGTNTFGCKDSINTKVVVNQTPVITSNSATICKGDYTSLFASGGATYYWTPGGSTSNPFVVNPSVNTTYKVIGTSIYGCKDSTTVQVTVNPLPVITATADTICKGETATITASGGATYKWTPGNSTANPLHVSPTVTTQYTVVGTNIYGCHHDTTTFVLVYPSPVITATSDSICRGDTAVLLASGGNAYVWYPGGSTANPLKVAPTVTTNYTVYGTTYVHGCKDSATTYAMIYPDIIMTFDADTTSGCDPVKVKFTADSGAVSYLWKFGDGHTSTLRKPTHTYTAGVYTVTLTVTSNKGCKYVFTNPAMINSYPQPIADFTWDPAIGVLADPTIHFYDITQPSNLNYNYIWNFGDSSSIDITKDPFHIYNEENSFNVVMIVRSNDGCADTVRHIIHIVNDSLTYPNIITPNGDGHNDKLVIKGLERLAYPDTKMIIYNRWGKVVYEKDNYNNDFTGEGLPDGVYYYVFIAKGLRKEIRHQSSLEILR